MATGMKHKDVIHDLCTNPTTKAFVFMVVYAVHIIQREERGREFQYSTRRSQLLY